MNEDLWAGVEFKLAEAEFFLEQMGKVLVPPGPGTPGWHPAWAGQSMTRWQPDFYYYLDGFLGAARSVPDVIQKCFGWDKKSGAKWPQPLDADEKDRRREFQKEFTGLYTTYSALDLSRVRVGTFHWVGVPSVQTKARVFCGPEYTGRPGQLIPSAAPRQFPPGTDPALSALFGQPLPVEPSRQDFTLEIPQGNGTTQSSPLFLECKAYLEAARTLTKEAKEICDRVHGGAKLTAPPAAAS
jgi:hypothetical protein